MRKIWASVAGVAVLGIVLNAHLSKENQTPEVEGDDVSASSSVLNANDVSSSPFALVDDDKAEADSMDPQLQTPAGEVSVEGPEDEFESIIANEEVSASDNERLQTVKWDMLEFVAELEDRGYSSLESNLIMVEGQIPSDRLDLVEDAVGFDTASNKIDACLNNIFTSMAADNFSQGGIVRIIKAPNSNHSNMIIQYETGQHTQTVSATKETKLADFYMSNRIKFPITPQNDQEFYVSFTTGFDLKEREGMVMQSVSESYTVYNEGEVADLLAYGSNINFYDSTKDNFNSLSLEIASCYQTNGLSVSTQYIDGGNFLEGPMQQQP